MRTQPSTWTSPEKAKPPLQDAVSLLRNDHQSILRLFDLLQAALEMASPEKDALCKNIFDALEIHTRLEEELFYPTIEQDRDLRGMVNDSRNEHAAAKSEMLQIKSMQMGGETIDNSMLILMDKVEKHIDEEERVLFFEVEKRFGGELDALGLQLSQRKRELAEHMANAIRESDVANDGPIF